MENFIKINDTLFVDLNNYHEQIDETEHLNIFEANYVEGGANYQHDVETSCKVEIKRYVDIFVELVKDKHVSYDISKKFKDSNLDIVRIIQAINNSHVKGEEFHFTRLMMIICLKNYIFHYVNKYLKSIIKDYERSKYKKEVKNFNCLIYSKGSGEILRKDTWSSGNQEWEDKTYSHIAGDNFLFIKFLSEDISKNFELLENGENASKHISEKEWAYLKEKILLLIKNSCVINCDENKKFSTLMEFINKNMYRSFKRHKSIVEMKKFNICLYFIDIFFNLFLIDYPYKWGNLLGDIFNTFNFISIYNSNDLANVINGDYNSTLSCLTDLMKCGAAASQMENMKEGGNNGVSNTHRVVIHFQNFYSLMFLMNKMVKKYIPRTQNNNSYSVLYHNYFISHINSSNKDLLETGEYSALKIPCENLLAGFKDIIKIFFPIFNRLLCTLLNYMESIYVVFMVKKIVKFLYKTLLCHFSSLPEELIKNELEILFTNIVNILDMDLDAYVHKLYFTNTSESSAKGPISVAKITEETSYENLSELIHNKDHNVDRLFLIILLKSKKWCLKILNMFLYRSIYFDEMNETWKLLLKNFENKYIIFLEKIALLILKAIINTNYTDEERMHYDKLICYIRYVVDFTDYLNFADKCLSLSLNYLCMIVSFDHLQMFVKQNILSEAFLGCLFVHIGSSSHVECVDNFFTNESPQKEESLLFENLKFERYIICFHKIPLYRKYLSDYYDDTKSKNVLKKYVNYIIFLFCELLDKYFYDIIFYLDANVKEHLRTCLVIQNEYMHVLYPDMFVKKEMDFSKDVVEISCYKKSNLLINAEMCMRTKNHNIYINSVMSCISEIIKKHMRENDIQHKVDLSSFYLLNSDTFNSLIFIIKNLPLYKYSQEELIFKDLYSMQNNHNLNFSCLIMNDINLYKYFSLFMFLVYYKWVFITRVLRGAIDEGVLLGGAGAPTSGAFAASGVPATAAATAATAALPTCLTSHTTSMSPMAPTFTGTPADQHDNRTSRESEDLTVDDYIEEYCKNKKKYKLHISNDDKEIEKFDQIVTDFKIRDKSFFLNYMLVNIFHPYSNNLKRVIMWMLKEYISMTRFSENVLQFFFYICFINLFYFEKHLKFKSFDTLINLMYKYGIPRQIFYNDFREVFTFLFFQLLILFIKNESNSHDNEFYEDNASILLSQNYEKRYFLSYLRGEQNPLCDYTWDKTKMWSSYLYNQVNCFTDFFINDVLYHNFQYYIEKMEVRNLNQFLNFISLFYQNEINNNIFLFINLLNESLLDTSSSHISGSDKEHSSFLKALKFFSFFLEYYKNASSTQDVLIIKILQGEKFIAYFKNIVRTVKKNQVILYSIIKYFGFIFYTLGGGFCRVTKLEKVANIPVYLFQFFSNVIRRDVLYFFFSLAEESPFTANSLNISLVEIFRKISLLLILLSEENLNEQHFCNNCTLHICGLYLRKKKNNKDKDKETNMKSDTNKWSHPNGGGTTNNVHSSGSSQGNINGGDGDQNRENKMLKLLNTVYFNIFLLKDKKREHIKMLLKTLKSINQNLVLNGSENEYHKYATLLMLQKKRYIYQSLSLYVFMDIQDFFSILVSENIFGSIIDEWLNDIFYIYQNSDDLKYFIFAFSNILIYLCMYEQKKRESGGCGAGGKEEGEGDDEEKGFPFLKSVSTTNSSMNNFDTILREIKMEFFDQYAIAQLRERLPRIINAVVNVFLILPIPYEENVKMFKKNILRRLAPICGEGDNIENNNLLKFNSDNSATDNLSVTFKEIHFNDLIQNIEFMHLNKYEQKFYERNQNSLKFSYDNVVHINKSEDLILYDKKISINYYFQSSIHDDFVNRLVSECSDEHFKIALYARKAFSLLNQEFFSNDDLIGILGCSDKYYNFVNVIRLDI
ncbi:hypothetical protein PCYB_111780 [Plasmodium cynomolgi strain B]|uniref:Uncharacterized protein n=1 Tax=Plasmodium cynomolgi (strain B) TaxID=1120755 RepID=K6VD65_PLACD|nr:hypothetical protein PCYB_111780 [Plasmodium cynomolgi strain B]GAB67157.1 hypothetical protein PCYB_111780 [Plasmodium cynomolgi strain B]